jgi:hypothetical protein
MVRRAEKGLRNSGGLPSCFVGTAELAGQPERKPAPAAGTGNPVDQLGPGRVIEPDPMVTNPARPVQHLLSTAFQSWSVPALEK